MAGHHGGSGSERLFGRRSTYPECGGAAEVFSRRSSGKRSDAAFLVSSAGPKFRLSSRQQSHAATDEDGCSPAAAVHVLMQEKLGGERVSHKSQRSGGGNHQADVRPGE